MSNTLSGVASAATDAATSKSGLRNIDELNTGTTASNALGKNEFLQILVAQMANQDPWSRPATPNSLRSSRSSARWSRCRTSTLP